MTTWRQGYCPPFGESITYWALAEIVKGHAGIRDTDDASAVEARLAAVLPAGPDREWFHQRLGALLGLAAPDASREENFAAWLRFFEEVAAAGPTVLVFEDLHWADEALLAFLEHLTLHLASVPLMIIGTTRPELFERYPSFAGGGRLNRLQLEPLSAAETARLVAGLLGERDDSGPVIGRVVGCDGNPFFAEQSVRLLSDTEMDSQVPESVQAVIAARLDALPLEQKALLADAAVVGSVFWDGVLTAMDSRDPRGVDGMLGGLLERKLIGRIRESSMGGEREFAFVHALAREVAYRQLPRVHGHAGTTLSPAGSKRRRAAAPKTLRTCWHTTARPRSAWRGRPARATWRSSSSSQPRVSSRWPVTVPSTSTCTPRNGSTRRRWSCRSRTVSSGPTSTSSSVRRPSGADAARRRRSLLKGRPRLCGQAATSARLRSPPRVWREPATIRRPLPVTSRGSTARPSRCSTTTARRMPS